jgi:uncharacterized membrane protein YqaE (UPF0057 family)
MKLRTNILYSITLPPWAVWIEKLTVRAGDLYKN